MKFNKGDKWIDFNWHLLTCSTCALIVSSFMESNIGMSIFAPLSFLALGLVYSWKRE